MDKLVTHVPRITIPKIQEKLGEEAHILKVFDLAAERFDIKQVNDIDYTSEQAQYCLTTYKIDNRIHFQLESNSPYFKTFMSAMVAHEKAQVTTEDVRHIPNEDVQFFYKEGRIEKQQERRMHFISEALEAPDEQLQKSIDALKGMMHKVKYSSQSEQDDVANFEIGGKKFHLSIEPSQNLRDGVLVLGVNIYASPLLQEVIKVELQEQRAAFKLRPTGLVADGPTSLNAISNLLLGDAQEFDRKLNKVESKISHTNNIER